jgi:hypothetical protein
MSGDQQSNRSEAAAALRPKPLTYDFEDVRGEESKAIWERRHATRGEVKPTIRNAGTPSDLVGLALSGGGIRAASVGLGALQALRDSRLLKEVDYMSTVSGGGYVGGYLSSAAISPETSVDGMLAAKKPTTSTQAGGHSALVTRFIFGGKYLNRPWEAANKYLIGLFLNNLLLFSGLVAFGACVALFWRLLDLDSVRDFLNLFYLGTDITAAFLPFLILFGIWLIAWAVTVRFRKEDAPNKLAQWIFIPSVASFLIGVTILLVNPEITLGFFGKLFGVTKIENNGLVAKWLFGIIAVGLTPFLGLKKLVRLTSSPLNLWQRALIRIAVLALTVGVPLLAVGVLSMRNISDTASDPDDNLRRSDVYNWPAFLGTLENVVESLRAVRQPVSDVPPDPHWTDHVSDGILNTLNTDLKRVVKKVDDVRRVELQLNPNFFARCWMLTGWFEQDNLLWKYWNGQLTRNDAQDQLCQKLNDTILRSRVFPFALAIEGKSSAQSDSAAKPISSTVDGFSRLRATANNRDNGNTPVMTPALAEAIADAELQYGSKLWNDDEAKEFNLSLLRALHPECFYIEGKAYRDVVVRGDEFVRMMILLAAAPIFLLSSCLINMNWSSMHRFYRDRIRHAFVIPGQGGSVDVDLSKLDTTKEGAPYHLINAAIDLNRPRFLDEVDAEAAKIDTDRRDIQSFLFSERYCGSDATGWSVTAEYEQCRSDNISLADALALSGAALSPLRTTSIGLKVAMWALNLNLGQWLPNPKRGRPSWGPSFARLLSEFNLPVAEATYCYVSDGGFADNLGIMALLRRRCRVIIAVDASCDSKGSFADLNAVIRNARMRYGVDILQLSGHDVLSTECLEPDEKGLCQRHFALARIKYPEEDAIGSWLVYFKPSFTGDEGADLMKYKLEDPEFPNDSTANQFYEPAKIESYRRLGFHMMQSFCKELKTARKRGLMQRMVALHSRLAEAKKTELEKASIKRDAVPTALAQLQYLSQSVHSAVGSFPAGGSANADSESAIAKPR